jgi:hypothetical protein
MTEKRPNEAILLAGTRLAVARPTLEEVSDADAAASVASGGGHTNSS